MKLRVVPAYREVERYIEAARTKPRREQEKLFEEMVVTPQLQACAVGSPFEAYARAELEHLQCNPDVLMQQLAAIETSHVDEIVSAALEHAAFHLPGPDTQLRILPPKKAFRGWGFSPSGGHIWVFAELLKGWQQALPSTVAHEYHHSVWTAMYYQDFNLATYLVFEGRANAFATRLYPDVAPPTIRALTKQQELELWSRMKPHLHGAGNTMHSFIFGNGRDIPRFSGYHIGYAIVEAFLHRHPRLTVAEWTAVNPYALIDSSGYGT